MKKYFIILSIFYLFGIQTNAQVKLKTEFDSVSYSIGLSIAKDIKTQLTNIKLDSLLNSKAIVQGFSDYYNAKAKYQIQPENAEKIVQTFFEKKQEEENKLSSAKYEKNIAEGAKFLEENKTKEGIKVFSNGVQYKVLEEGTSEKVSDTSVVLVHYTGSLIDGRIFDSSLERGEPIELPVQEVIPGLSSTLSQMTVGSRWLIYIPQELAYGANVNPDGIIEPYSVLIFEIQILKIVK